VLKEFSESPGQGIAARVEIAGIESPLLLGSRSSTLKAVLKFPQEIEEAANQAQFNGSSISILVLEGEAIAAFEVGDSLRKGAKELIVHLEKRNIETWLISGDSTSAVNKIAEEVGINLERCIAGASPEDKLFKIRELSDNGKKILMVGDGVNDAAALAEADLSMAMGTGTDTAIATADITLMRPELNSVSSALELSTQTLKTIKGNLLWAFLYNTIGIPIAALGLLNPMIAGAAMATSSLFVVINSLRLKGKIRKI
jgi:Cu+-exporting ATPase